MRTTRIHPIVSLLLLTLTLSWSACLNNNTDCVPTGNCNIPAPTTGNLNLKLTIDNENPRVPLAIYLGDASDSVLFFTDTVSSERYTYPVGLDQKYSAVAKYRRGALTILAVDGGRTSLSTSNDCGDTCYEVKDADLNLRLAK